MSIVLSGKSVEVPGITTRSWLEDPKRVPRILKTTPRTRTLRSIFIHTTKGLPCPAIRPGAGTQSSAFAEARYQARPLQHMPDGTVMGAASFDAAVGQDGVAVWQNDPLIAFTWHAMQVNSVSLGIEMCQNLDGTLYEVTIQNTCLLVVSLCEALSIQKQVPWNPVIDAPYAGRIERMDPGFNGSSCVGVFGHRNVWVHPHKNDPGLTAARGPGDPGDEVFRRLVSEHRFERFAFHGADPEDWRVWKARQLSVGFEGADADGTPLTRTTVRLKELGYKHGIWVDGPSVPTP